MPSKKRVHLQQSSIIHLLNPDLIYIKNPERNKILFVPFHLLKTYIRNPSLFFISFFTPHLEGNGDGNHDPRAHIYAQGGGFCQVSIFAKLICQTVGGQFFLVLPKLNGCQVGFPNYWSCSNNTEYFLQIAN
jgi:hypothetical protein